MQEEKNAAKPFDRSTFIGRRTAVIRGVRFFCALSACRWPIVASAAWAAPAVDPTANSPQSLPEAIRSRAKRWGIPFDKFSLDIRDLSSGRRLLGYRDDMPHAPASTVKLLTTFAALDILEARRPDFRFETVLWRRKGDGPEPALVLEGGGDPCFSAESLERMFETLAAQGVKTIEGDILIDRSYFSAEAGVEPQPLSSRYRRTGWEKRWQVGPDAMSIGARTVSFAFVPRAGGAADVRMTPELDGIDWQKTVKLSAGRCVDWDDRLGLDVIRFRDGRRRVVFRGTYASLCGKDSIHISLDDADRFAERLIRTVWRRLGGVWQGSFRSSASGERRALAGRYVVAARWLSAPLSDLVRQINKDSLNAGAQSLFLSLSQERTNAASARVVARWLDEKGIDRSRLNLPSGSGLDGRTRFVAKFMGDILAAAYADGRGDAADEAAWQAFFASLPVAGVDGTMRRRGIPGVRAHVKTGTLAGTRSLAGYVEHPSGRLLSVYASVSGVEAMPGATAFLDGVLLWMTRLPLPR